MEIARSQTGVLRFIAKVVLLGLLVVLLAKAILTLVALAAVGLVLWVGGRALYLRRASFSRMVVCAQEALILGVSAAFRLMAVLVGIVGWLLVSVLWAIMRLARTVATMLT